MRRLIPTTIIILLAVVQQTAFAKSLCHGNFVNPITDVCWSCLFPLSLGDVAIANGHQPDTDNPTNPVCACPGNPIPRIGLSIGFWEPIRLVDVTRHPFCLVNLGGMQLKLGHYGEGKVEQRDNGLKNSFYYVHWYAYPLLSWLNILTDAACIETGDFDIAYLSELDPTWGDDELSFLINPEAALFANPIPQTACAADSLKSLLGLPIDKLFWCAGSQGAMYPLTGHVGFHISGAQASTLLTERMAYKLHRQGLLWDSSGDSLCRQHLNPIMPKSRYRYQMVNPKSGPCKPFGHTTSTWESFHEYPIKGEDFGYLVWRKRNCCAL